LARTGGWPARAGPCAATLRRRGVGPPERGIHLRYSSTGPAITASRIVVDLARIELIDSCGLLLLVAVRNPSCVVRRVIELAGLDSMLNLTP